VREPVRYVVALGRLIEAQVHPLRSARERAA
jgi:hypothetical protein